MDNPQTRKEKKKDQREKAEGKNGGYSSKHVRISETLKEKRVKK
uniref:Uncharacterized protein n=1 Tax=viral metagenome TaxID=1070528 RepID=A0A6C0EU24_9ZZZZ